MPDQVKPPDRYDVFLSHSSVDDEWAARLKAALTAKGLTVWLDLDEIRPGDVFVQALERGLESSGAVAIIVSPESMASGWVSEEYSRALSMAKSRGSSLPLIPILLQDAELPGFLANRSWADFRDEDQFDASVEQLIRGIRRAPGEAQGSGLGSGGRRRGRLSTGGKGGSAVIRSPIGIQILLLILLLVPAILLLMYATGREQIVGAFVLFALASAVVTFGLLSATGAVKTRNWKLGGAAAGFCVVLGMLLPFAHDPTADIRGAIYLDGFAPKNATVYLLETELRDNRKDLEERDQGQFEFKDVRGLGKEVRLRITLPGGLEHVAKRPFKAGQFIRISLIAKDFSKAEERVVGEGLVPSRDLSACLDASDRDSRVIYLFDLQNSTMEAVKLNAFLNLLSYKLDHGIRNHLISQQLLDRKLLRVQRCSALSVGSESVAIRLGGQLKAPAVLWGYAEQDQGQLRSLITFTSLVESPISVYQPLPYDADIVRLAELDQPVEDIYLAFASFVLGQDYLRSNEMVMARRCLLHAEELSPPSTTLRDEIEEVLRKLESLNVARGLEPVG
jgi:hypothetical protein